MNKIRVIDLLNKIANGEEVPNKIKYKSIVLCYHEEEQDYGRYWGSYLFEHLFKMYDTKSFINDEIEIIEEPKKIEKMDLFILDEDMDIKTLIAYLRDNNRIIKTVINEIIDYINSKEDK